MKRVYICGPMTDYPMHNFPAFFKAEEELITLGWDVTNPARNQGGGTPQEAYANHVMQMQSWEWYLRKDIKALLDCDAVVVLPGWESSRGALLEVHVAEALGMPVRSMEEMGAVSYEPCS